MNLEAAVVAAEGAGLDVLVPIYDPVLLPRLLKGNPEILLQDIEDVDTLLDEIEHLGVIIVRKVELGHCKNLLEASSTGFKSPDLQPMLSKSHH